MTRIKTILAAVVTMIALASCQQEIADFTDRLDDLENRVSKLEQLCAEMNTNISSLQSIVTAMQSGDYITSVKEITEGGKTIGYTITFAKGDPITIYHGQDGANGQDGKDGKDGKDGADGHTPVIGVKQDTDGIWYWTIDGEWLLDANGQKVKAVGIDGKDGADGQDGQNGANGQDGADGQDGQDGKDGVTPQLKIEDGYWYVSTDNGQTWTKLDKATGENGKDGADGKDGKDGQDGKDGDSMFQSMTVTETDVTFVTADGQTFVIKRASALSIVFDSADLVVMGTNSTRDIHYTITSGIDDITIEALSSADIKVKVVKTDAKTGALNVKTGAAIDEYSKVVVLVSNGSQAIMRTLNFEAEAIEVEENTTKEVSDEGGEVMLEFFSNVPCHAEIPLEAQSWISVAPATKTMDKQTIGLIIQPNTGAARSATVVVQSEDGLLALPFVIEQQQKPASKALLPPFPLSAGLDTFSAGLSKAITNINFYVNSDKVTETIISDETGYSPIYFELNGTVANYYTKGEVYQVTEGNGNSLFCSLLKITSIDLSHFDTSQCTNFAAMFSGCLNLKEIIFGDFNTGNAMDMSQMFQDCISLEAVDLSSFNTTNVQNMNYMFLRCYALKELDLSNFDTRNVTQMGEIFEGCYRLEKLDISSFSSDNLQYGSGLFNRCYSLLKLNLGSFDLSSWSSNSYTCYKMASRSRNCAVLCTPATKAVLLSSEAQLRGSADYIQWFSPGETLPDLTMNYDPNLYRSTDYSKDKTVKMLNTATEGNGINVVIMGEAYSDRLIADGTYEQDMTAAMNQVFSVEPFKSFKHLFNVYMVTAVSENEVVGEFTALGYNHDSWFGNGGVDRDDIAINEYVSQAVGRDEDREVTTLVVVNQTTGDGVAMVNGSTNDADHYDYPAKIVGVAFACKSIDTERFKYVVCHEFGHAFAALHDEYVTETGEMDTWESDYKKYYQAHAGWWANVSFTSDPNLVGWSQFLAPGSGYDETEVSIIEGALYSQGIWKSVDHSMMNAGGEFSVPAREAIYKKIHKVAYGEEWQYNIDDFVAWDRQVLPKQAASPNLKVRARKNNYSKHLFKMEESIAPDGRKMVTVIMD